MVSRDHVDQLRTILVGRGHIIPTKTHRDNNCKLLNHGEYLISLLSQDDSLFNSDENLEPEEGLDFYESIGKHDFDVYVDTVKLVWMVNGVSAALQFVQMVGFVNYRRFHSLLSRRLMADELARQAESTLRQAGVKHRDMAEFLADGRAVQLVSENGDEFAMRVPRGHSQR